MVAHVAVESRGVPQVLMHEADRAGMVLGQPVEIPFGARAAQVVQHSHQPAGAGKRGGCVDTKESGSAGDQHAP